MLSRPVAAPVTPPSVAGNVILIGLMGAGKSSIGRLLAKRLGKTFIDSDHELERRTGVRIPVIFDIEGEAGFRAREAALIAELAARDDIVLATGGGAVLAATTRALLPSRGHVIYLRAAVDELWHRTRHDKQRPLLQTANPRSRLAELLRVREPLYRKVAHVVIETGSQSLPALTERIVTHLASARPSSAEGTDRAAVASDAAPASAS